MAGKLYGVGVGPGDPQLLTLKALQVIKTCDYIAVPAKKKEASVAYRIVKQVIENLDEKPVICVDMPMTKDKEQLEKAHEAGTQLLREKLDQNLSVAFLTLGDPTIYSTYLYVHKRIHKLGYDTQLINGITSFCAVAAALNTGLSENSQMLHIIPASGQIADSMQLSGTKIFMKAGKKMEQVKKLLKEYPGEISMVENCGMEHEKHYYGLEEIPDDPGYYSVVVVKEK